MQLTKADERAYPRLYYYLKNDIPKLVHHVKISKGLLKYGQIKRATLKKVLGYGTGPMVKITPLVDACGEFTARSKSNELRLHKSLVDRFEKIPGDRILLMTVGGTLLHELAHWGDDQNGLDYPGEEGELFERYVYNIPHHHCSHYYLDLVKKGVVF